MKNPIKIPRLALLLTASASLIVSPQTFGASITWGTPVTISGDTDVSTTGALVYAYDESNTGTTVNTVPFAAGNSATSLGSNVSLSGFTGGVNNSTYGSISSLPYSGLSSSYKSALQGAAWTSGATAATVTLNNLAVGHKYLVQIWANDDRTSTTRTETVSSSGGNTVTLNYNSTGTGGGVGQYTIGIFTADATMQSFTLTGSISSQFNTIQVRDTSGYLNGASGTIWDASTTADWATASGGPYNQAWSAFGGLATFEGTAGTVTVNGPVSANNILFTTDGYTLAQGSSGALTLANGSITTGSGSDTIGVVLAGTGGVTKSGSGMLTLSGANTYAGTTAINQGSLTLSGAISSSSALALGGGTLNYTLASGSQTFASATINPGFSTLANATAGQTVALGSITRNSGGILNVSSLAGTTTTSTANDGTGILGTWATEGTGTSLQYATGGGTIAAYGGATAGTAGTLANVTSSSGNYSFGAAATQSGAITANTLRYTGGAATWANGGFGVTLNGLMNAGTGLLTESGTGAITIGANKELVIVGNNQGTTTGSVIADNSGGASALTYGGPSAGTLTLSGVNTYSGPTTISSGTLSITGSGSLGSGASYSAAVTDNGALNYSSSANQTLSGVISGTGSVTNSGSGSLTLSGANTYSGGTVSAGKLFLQANSTPTSGTVANGPLGTGSLTLNGGTFGFGGTLGYTIANNVNVGGATSIEVASAQNEQINGNWSGSGNLTLVANGTTGQWGFGGDNSGYTGTFTQNSGNTSLRFDSAASGSASAAWVFNNTLSQRTRFNFTSGTISLGSLSGNGNLANVSGTAGTITLSVGGLNSSTTFAGVIAGNGTKELALTKIGTGSLTLSGANSYGTSGGATTVENGALIAGAAVTSGSAGPFGQSSAAIALGDATTIGSVSAMSPQLHVGGAFTMGRPVTVGANNNSLNNSSTTFTIGGNTANSSTFSGAITLNQNLVISQATGGTLTISGGITSGSSGTQTITVNNAAPVTIGTGAIGGGTGTIALTKNGTSTLTLTGTHTYTGNTTVSGGTLLVNGSTASGSMVSVSGSSSVLGGSGTVGGNTTISASSALTPRPNAGSATTLTFGGNLSLSSASANFTLSSSGSGANDQIVYGASGTLTLDSSDTINISNAGGLDQANDYTLFTSAGGTVSMVSAPTLKINGATISQGTLNNFEIVTSGNTVKLHYLNTATPPVVNSATASPASLGHYQTTTVTVNVSATSGNVTNVSVSVDGLGGSGDPTSLTGPGGNGTGNWTGTFSVPAGLVAGGYTISGTVNQDNGGVAPWSVSGISVTNSSPTWSGAGSDNKWSTAGNWASGYGPGSGDTVTFAGSTQLTNNLDTSLALASLTFNSNAGNFDITNAASTLTLTGGLTNNSVNMQTLDVPLALNGAQSINAAAGNVTINRSVSDSGAGLTLTGSGTLTLSAANTFSGATTISGGILAIAGNGSLGNGSYSAGVTDNGALNYGSSANQTLSGTISGTGSVLNSGNGTLTLNGTNTYGGGTTISAGTITFGNGSALGTGTVTANSGTLKWNYVSGNTAFTNDLIANGATTLDVNSGNWNFYGNISGSGAITRGISATLSLYLGGDNSGYAGTFTSPNNGNAVVRFTSPSAGSAAAGWIFNNSTVGRTTIEFTGNGTIAFGSLAGSGQIQAGVAGTKTISAGALGLDDIFSGVIANGTGTIGLTKVGSGTMTLSGVNTYSGNTTITAGTLALSGSGSIANSTSIALAGGATFDVSGLPSTFTLGSGQTLTNINGTGILAGNLNLASGALALNYTNGTPSLNVTNGTLNFNSNTVTVSIDGTLAHGIYKLISTNAGGQITGTLPSNITVNNIGTATGSLSVSNNELYLTVNHAPVAGNATYTRNAGINSLRIVVSDLLTNVTDADGDSITLVSVGTSTNGITPTVAGGLIGYYNTNNVDDQFSYTVTDGFGDTVSGMVNISINTSEVTGTNSIVGLSYSPAGNTVKAFGIPGYNYVLERTTNMSPSVWVEVQTNTAAANGVINASDTFNDLGGVPPLSAYYRLKWQ